MARGVHLGVKRAFDACFALAALAMLLPLLLVLALAVRLSGDGPVLFKQDRVGRGGRIFTLYKFRTMRSEDTDFSGVAQTQADDPRVTPLGRWMRRTSFDELPQLLNILKGDMSFVGPRPHVLGQLAAGMPYERLVPYYGLRTFVRPGLTGWAQANGFRGPTNDPVGARARIEHDLAYMQHASLLLDVKIIVRTAVDEFFTGTGV